MFKISEKEEINRESEKPHSMRDTIGIEIRADELDKMKDLAVKRQDTEDLMEGLGNKPQGSMKLDENSHRSQGDNMN